MEDLTNGRINTKNLTAEEWAFLGSAYDENWFVPENNEWLLVRNLLGLFDIRRGYSITEHDDMTVTLHAGTAQVKLNEHGLAAWELKYKTGRYYQSGKPNTIDDFAPHMDEQELDLFDYLESIVGTQLKSLSKPQQEVYWNTPELEHCTVCGVISRFDVPQCDCINSES